MVGLDLASRLIKVNVTKVRKDETIPPGKPGIDFLLPDEKESLQKEQGGSSTDSKERDNPFRLRSQHPHDHCALLENQLLSQQPPDQPDIPRLIQDLQLLRTRTCHGRADHPMPPAPPDSPVDPPRPRNLQKQSISSSSGLNRLGGDVPLPSQSPSSQPILPTVVVPSPPAILTNPEAENDDEELELPNLVQEEEATAPPVQSSSSKKQKTGKKKKPGENPDDEDSPGSSLKSEPAASSNFNLNNPVNLPMQSDSEEELLPHVPTSTGTGSSQRTLQHTDQEEDESEDSQQNEAAR